jgi:hypothetical protein
MSRPRTPDTRISPRVILYWRRSAERRRVSAGIRDSRLEWIKREDTRDGGRRCGRCNSKAWMRSARRLCPIRERRRKPQNRNRTAMKSKIIAKKASAKTARVEKVSHIPIRRIRGKLAGAVCPVNDTRLSFSRRRPANATSTAA